MGTYGTLDPSTGKIIGLSPTDPRNSERNVQLRKENPGAFGPQMPGMSTAAAPTLTKEEGIRKTISDQLNKDREAVNKASFASGQQFANLARQQLGGLEGLDASQKAQGALLRKEVQGQTIANQRALAGKLSSQGVRGGAAVAAQGQVINQGAAQQANVMQKLAAERADKEQALKQQILSAIIAGQQFGATQEQQLISQRMNQENVLLKK